MKASIIRILILGLSTLVWGQAYNLISSQTALSIDSTYQARLEQKKAAALSLAIIDDGRIVYSRGYGFSDIQNAKPASDQTVYRIGSATKTFSSLATLQLVEAGKLNLETPVKDLLQGWEPANYSALTSPPRLKHILSHTAGFPGDLYNGFFANNPPDHTWTIEALNKGLQPLDPNDLFLYSNVAYGLLEGVIERSADLPYETYLKQHIFEPLSMGNTWITPPQHGPNNLAQAYLKGKLVNEPLIRDVSAGLIHSSVLDMADFMLMLLDSGRFQDNQIISYNSLSLMQNNHLSDLRHPTDRSYGFGLQIEKYNYWEQHSGDSSVAHLYGHGGNTLAYHCDYAIVPELGVGVVLLVNSDRGRTLTKAEKLLGLYLELEKGIILDIKNPLKSNDRAPSLILSPEDLVGHYSTLLGHMHVTDPNKIRTWQGPAKIIFNRQKDGTYVPKARLLGVIPVKIHDQIFRIVNNKVGTYFEVHFPSTGRRQRIGIKLEPKIIPPIWLERTGKYQITGETFDTPEGFPFDLEETTATLKEKHGFLVFDLDSPTRDLNNSYVMSIYSDSLLINKAYARNTGESIRLEADGTLSFSGMSFKKTN